MTSEDPGPGPALVALDTPRLLTALWHQVLQPSFAPDELVALEDLLAEHAAGRVTAWGVVEEGGDDAGAGPVVVAGVVGTWSALSGVLLVDYLALAPGHRGRGTGTALLDAALARWATELGPRLVLAEVEHPAHHPTDAAHGDPTARLRFYARRGARVLALPYFQPGLAGPGSARVPALLLVVLAGVGPAAPWAPATPLRDFLTEHLIASEGSLARDGATRRLLGAVQDDVVPLVDPQDPGALAGVPVGVLEGRERHAPGRSSGSGVATESGSA